MLPDHQQRGRKGEGHLRAMPLPTATVRGALAAAASSGWAYINALAQTRSVLFRWIALLPPITVFRLAVWAHEAGCLSAGTKWDNVVGDEVPEACAASVLGRGHPWFCSAAFFLLSSLLARWPRPLCTSWWTYNGTMYIYARGKRQGRDRSKNRY